MTIRQVRSIGAVTTLLVAGWLGSGHVQAADNGKRVFGWVELAEIRGWGVVTKVKMDTGALSSTMEAADIESFRRNAARWVRFRIRLRDQNRDGAWAEREFERPVLRYLRVISSNGESQRRPVVAMRLCIGGEVYEETFTLADRSKLIYPILLGRRTIEHLGLIDVTQTYLTKPVCGANAPLHRLQGRKPDKDIGL